MGGDQTGDRLRDRGAGRQREAGTQTGALQQPGGVHAPQPHRLTDGQMPRRPGDRPGGHHMVSHVVALPDAVRGTQPQPVQLGQWGLGWLAVVGQDAWADVGAETQRHLRVQGPVM